MFLPTWKTDRLCRASAAGPPDAAAAGDPLVTVRTEGQRRVIDGACAAALALGLRPGMSVARAQAMRPGLRVTEAAPEAEMAELRRLAVWARAYSPLTAPDPPDGFWLETTGCDHLHGGEAAMLASLCARLARAGITARAAVADTPGAAHALARHAEAPCTVAAGEARALLRDFPVACLRLSPESLAALHRVGLERAGQVFALPRAPLARRFGAELLRRRDQALGSLAEPVAPLLPPVAFAQRRAFLEPLLTAEAFAAVIAVLVPPVCAALEREGQGARRLDLLLQRVDGSWQAVRIGTARATRAPAHLIRLLVEQVPTVDPGLGVEAMQLLVTLAEPLAYAQASTGTALGGTADAGVAELVDRLAGRLGAGAVYRAAPVESRVPERAVRRMSPLGGRMTGPGWPARLRRPARLFDPPQPVQVMALLPDNPPVQFVWRRVRHRIPPRRRAGAGAWRMVAARGGDVGGAGLFRGRGRGGAAVVAVPPGRRGGPPERGFAVVPARGVLTRRRRLDCARA